jgi:hypothetical protein
MPILRHTLAQAAGVLRGLVLGSEMRRRAWAQAFCATALLGSWHSSHPSIAGAKEALEPRYAVAEGCPSRKEWAQALDARLPEPLRAHPALERLTIEISRERARDAGGARYTGQLGSVDDAAGEARRVSGASCAEVVQALTLIAALELQRADAPEVERASAPPEDVPSSVDPERGQEALRVGAVAFALLQSGRAPRWTADMGAGVSLRWRTESLQPWLLLGAYWGRDELPVGQRNGLARFERWSSYFVGCPVRFPRQTALGVRPCASLEVGRISGQGLRVNDAAESAALLASAGLDVRLEWSILERLELGALFGGVAALSRPRFYFSPEITALEVAPGGLRTGVSASLSF